jgi:glyoxylase-like metal-dependent hydrolase (beta-lactamase superfamily II)
MRVGEIQVDALSDGAFVARPRYFGQRVSADARPELFDRDGAAWLPIGCFLIQGGGRVILVDAGLGPDLQSMPDGMWLVGGQLLTGLRALGVRPAQVTDVICTHFHADHVGWLFGLDERPVFPHATIWFGAADWDHFVDGPGEMAAHIEGGFRRLGDTERLHPLERDEDVAPGVRVVVAPGHTPGHVAVTVESGRERLILLGDAITAPQQMDEVGWHSMGDVDVAMAEQSRRALWDRLGQPGTRGVGAHFPELRAGIVEDGCWAPVPA